MAAIGEIKVIIMKPKLFYVVAACALFAAGAWFVEAKRVGDRDESLNTCNESLDTTRTTLHETHGYAEQLEGRLNQCLKELPPEKVNWDALREICPKVFADK